MQRLQEFRSVESGYFLISHHALLLSVQNGGRSAESSLQKNTAEQHILSTILCAHKPLYLVETQLQQRISKTSKFASMKLLPALFM